MEKIIIQTRGFSKTLAALVKKRQLLLEDFDAFKKSIIENPEMGEIIVGTGGIRKVRLKSATKGKSGGFRICYYYLMKEEEIFLLVIYAKNEKENLTMDEKRDLKSIISEIKGT